MFVEHHHVVSPQQLTALHQMQLWCELPSERGCASTHHCLERSLFSLFRSTLVSKEPESMLAHMFREKGK